MPAYPTPRAAVLTRGGVFYDNGQAVKRTIQLGDRMDLPALLDGAARAFRHDEGVLVISASLSEVSRAAVWRPVTDWKYSQLRAWTTFVRLADNTIVHVGLIGEMFGAEGKTAGPLLAGSAGPREVAARLGRYHQLTGIAWRATAGVTGCAGIRHCYTDPRPGRQPLWHSQGVKGLRAAGPLIWRATDQPDVPLPISEPIADVHVYDINAMYLAALKNVRLGWSALTHTGAVGFDSMNAGYWELDATKIPTDLYDGKIRPPVFPSSHIHKNGVWVTTPVAKYIGDVTGETPTVLDSWTCENSATIGRLFAERLIAVRRGDYGPPLVADTAIKRTYTELVGMFGREGGSISRPDWHHNVMDLARINMLRRVEKVYQATGIWPIAVRTDAVYYHGPTQSNLAQALGIGVGAGMFKYQESLTVADYHARVVKGQHG